MSIENPTLAHFRHFSSLLTNLPSTTVENPLQIGPFMQNKAKVKIGKMNANYFTTSIYKKKSDWTFGENKPKQSQSSAFGRKS